MKNKLVFAIITIIVVILALSVGNVCANDASIGIIRGADGPTAIFVTNSGIPTLVIVLNIIIVAIIAVLIRKKLKKK